MVATEFNPRRFFWPRDVRIDAKIQKNRMITRTETFMERIPLLFCLILSPIRFQWPVLMSR